MTLLTSPHLPQVFLIDSRALARLRYAQMFSTEPFIIEIVWFNLYSAVLQLCQHLSPTLGEKQKNSTELLSALACLTYLYILPGTATQVEEERKLMVRHPPAQPRSHTEAWTHTQMRSLLTCHLKHPPPPPQRETEGLREMNPSDVRVKSAMGGRGRGQEGREEAAKLRQRDCQLFR